MCGEHRGIIHYTVGQRKRLGIALGRPVFIKRIDPETNRIYLADAGSEFAKSVTLSYLSIMSGKPLDKEFKCNVKIRSAAKPVEATVLPISSTPDNMRAEVVFDEPQRAPAKGQSVVMYDFDGCVVGGGFIDCDIE